MNAILNSIFKYLMPDLEKLISYGFKKENGIYRFDTPIVGEQMRLFIEIAENNEIRTKVIDLATEEEFTLFLVESAQGSFIGEVRADYERVLTDIANACFYRDVFKSEMTKPLIEFISKTYGDELEFLWEDLTNVAVWRRKDTGKWYGIIFRLPKSRLGLDSSEEVDFIDIRLDPDKMDSIVDNVSYFRGYHMNKKHWLTVLLDGSIPFDEITDLVSKSYALAKKK